jgi:ribose transport system substrate-binding protein
MTLAQIYTGFEGRPPTSGPPAAKQKVVYWVSCGQTVPTCAEPPAGAAQAAKTLGWTFKIADGMLTPSGELAAARVALAAHPDAIVFHGVSCAYVLPVLKQAKAEHIITIGAEAIDRCHLYTANMLYSASAPTVEDWFGSSGTIGASYIIDRTHGQADVINENFTDDLGIPENTAVLSVFRSCAGCKIVDALNYIEGDPAPGGKLHPEFRTALVQHPEANAMFYGFSINVVAGDGQAILQAHRSNFISAGGDGGAAGLDLVRRGIVTENTNHDTGWMGYAVMDELNRAFNHQPAVPEGIGVVGVDKGHNLNPQAGTEYHTKVPYAALYTKLWGK